MSSLIKIFKINEVSKLYNVGIDSLRYYERIGLLVPKRDPQNRYRTYSYEDLSKLNMILELNRLKFPFFKIKEILDNKTLLSTLSLLNEELSLIEDTIKDLEVSKSVIFSRIASLTQTIKNTVYNTPSIIHLSERRCIHITNEDVGKTQIDYFIGEYIHKHQKELTSMIGRYDCYRLDINTLNENGNYKVKEVFIINNSIFGNATFTLPEGDYLSVSFNGTDEMSKVWVPKLLEYAKINHIKLEGEPVELCKIDLYETNDPNEYVTELQFKIIT